MAKINLKEVDLVKSCVCCHSVHDIYVNFNDWCDWDDGALAVEAFPYLEPEEREMLISGICPDCWEKIFGGIDDTEEEEEEDGWIEFEPGKFLWEEMAANP